MRPLRESSPKVSLIWIFQILLFRGCLDRERFLTPSPGETHRRTLGVLSCLRYVFPPFLVLPSQTLLRRHASRVLVQLGEQPHECCHLRTHISLCEYLRVRRTMTSSKRRPTLDSTLSWQQDLVHFRQIHTTRSYLTVRKSFDTRLLSSHSVCPSSNPSS